MGVQKYNVTGMSCAACQARVEKAVGKVPGVNSVAVSLLTGAMGVEGTADAGEIIRAVEKAGYGASLQEMRQPGARLRADGASGAGAAEEARRASEADTAAAKARLRRQEEALRDTETPKLRRRLIASVCILLVLMYGSMGHMMLGWPLPSFFDGNHVAMGIGQMLLAGIIMLINGRFFTSGFRSLVHLAPNMDTLVALGSMASFVWSLLILFKMTADQAAGNADAVMADMESFYFESAAMIVTLITVGKLLEAHSKGRTTDALKSLLRLAPQTAAVEDADGSLREIPVEELAQGDIFLVRPGEKIPVDGVILEGTAAIDEAALTGESIPVDKGPGDPVSAATTNTVGFLRARATRVGEDTTLAQIIRMVSDAATTKAPIARIADRVSGIFVPAVIGIAACVILIWLLLGASTGYALARGIAVLVISCPCALGLATPVAIMVGNGVGARNGILFKTAASLEAAGRTQVIALDKTGTITEGNPRVTELIPAAGIAEEELVRCAAALEAASEHPIARAITAEAKQRQLRVPAITDFRALPGNGLQGRLDGQELVGGSLRFIGLPAGAADEQDATEGRDKGAAAVADSAGTAALVACAQALAGEGKTPMAFTLEGRLLGIIAVADTIKADSPRAIQQLKGMGIHVVMLTGDNEKTARAIGRQAGVDEVIAGVLPEGKDAEIQRLARRGRVAMVGDGINDAPALTRADTGIAIGAGADVAIDAADIVLMNSRLTDVAAAIRLSRATLRNIHENLFWAFIYNVLLIPLAAGAWTHFLGGWTLNPMLAAAAMSLSSFCVCMNALRLNLKDIYDPGRDRPLRRHRDTTQPKEPALAFGGVSCQDATAHTGEGNHITEHTDKEKQAMKKTINIEGMMCPHCEATVKKALEAVEGVSEATVSHEADTAVVELNAEVADEVLTKAIEDKDYKVLSIG